MSKRENRRGSSGSLPSFRQDMLKARRQAAGRSANASMASASTQLRTAAATQATRRSQLAAQNMDDEPEGSEPPLVLRPVESLYHPLVQSFNTPAPINSYYQPAQHGAISQSPMPTLTTGQASQHFKDRFLEQPSLRQAPIGSLSQPNWVYNTHLNPQLPFAGTWSTLACRI